MEYNGKKQIINQLSEKTYFFNKKYKNFFTYKIIYVIIALQNHKCDDWL